VTNKKRNENVKGNTPRDINAAQRVQLALSLRAQKKSYDEIAALAGYASRGAAHNAVQRELERSIIEDVAELRREECAMLDRLHAKCWERLEDPDYAKSMLFAVDRINFISERRSRLMGLDRADKDAVGNVVVIREIPSGYLTEVKSEANT
jgi:hypothetical protein